VAEIERMRRERKTGPSIARALGMPRSTVGVVLRRLGLGKLKALEVKLPPNRYERAAPGELIHGRARHSKADDRDHESEEARWQFHLGPPDRSDTMRN
jgi:hypothetical protein